SVFGPSYGDAMADLLPVVDQLGAPALATDVELVSPAQLEARRHSPFPRVMGVSEVSEIVELSRQRVSQLARKKGKHSDFPDPIAHLHATPLWLGEDIEKWVSKGGPRRSNH